MNREPVYPFIYITTAIVLRVMVVHKQNENEVKRDTVMDGMEKNSDIFFEVTSDERLIKEHVVI